MLNKFDSLLLYLLVYIFSALCISKSRKSAYYNRIALLLIGIGVPVLLAGIRYQVGTDFNNYHWMYNSYASMSAKQFFTSRELFYGWGVWFVCKISQFLGGEKIYFTIFALLTMCFGIKGFEKYKDINWFLVIFALLLGPFSTGLNTMKQAVAMAIIFWGFQFVYERNIVKYLLSVMLAVMFHTSALIAIPIYFAYKPNEHKIWNLRSILLVFLAVFASANIMNILSTVSRIDFMNISRFASYTTEGTGNLTFYLTFIELLIIIFHQKKLVQMDDKNALLIVLMGLGVVLNTIGFVSVFVKRISIYFTSYPLLVLFSQLSKTNTYKYNKQIYDFALCIFFVVVFILYFFVRGQGNIIPYGFAF